ncbi:hypothetical protein ACJW31_03G168400 [Castanea mollissima]
MASLYYHLFFTFLAFFLSTLIFFLTHKTKSKKLNLPPGPPKWPIVGNLFQVANSGKPFFKYVDGLQSKYDPIFSLRMGTGTMTILSDAKLVHKALVEKGQLFATRPRKNPTRNMFSNNKFTTNTSLYGPAWCSLRHNMVQNMLSSSRLKEFRQVRDAAMEKLINRLRTEAKSNDGVVYEETNKKFDQVMKTLFITLDPRIDDYIPILSPFFSKQRKSALEVQKRQINFIVSYIEKCRKALKNPGFDKTQPQLIANPHVQDKLHEEIKVSVGDRKVDDHPPTYFSLTHAVTEPTTLAGYDIPTDVNVEIYLLGMSEDPKLWTNPSKFEPERFVSGKEDADITGVTEVKMMPFGVGRRICPSLTMAIVHVHLMLAKMVQ